MQECVFIMLPAALAVTLMGSQQICEWSGTGTLDTWVKRLHTLDAATCRHYICTKFFSGSTHAIALESELATRGAGEFLC
jgi:hypothetical protein